MILTKLDRAEELVLPASSVLKRVQRKRSRPGTVSIGPVRLPPSHLCSGRFDIVDSPVGYFADSAETAMYESIARRECEFLPIDLLRGRVLLTVCTKQELRLLDLSPCTHDFPVLQSLRYGQTQELAHDALHHGYDGIAYHSAQRHGALCYALFDSGMRSIRKVHTNDLIQTSTGAFHTALANVIRGSSIPLA